jgi:nitrite reductase (NADH) small subunit
MNADMVKVARLEDLLPGEKKVVDIDGTGIGLFNIDGEVYALENVCPHQGGPLCEGDLFRHLDAEVTANRRIRKFFRSEERTIVACPWHGYEFEIKTGACLVNPMYSALTLPVEVRDDGVYVGVPVRAAAEA